MMGFLGFLSDLILFTFGMIVLLLWIALIIAIAIEIYDAIMGLIKKSTDVDLDEEDDV